MAALIIPTAASGAEARREGKASQQKENALVDLREACPEVVIDLRYATERNLTGKPIYPRGARALLRKSVAQRLNHAQRALQEKGFGLKVWDAYRPPWVQQVLWNAVKNPAYVVEPSHTGSLHSWGTAVDVTLVDFGGREVRMPTDYDAFTPDARYDYKGKDPAIAYHVRTLKKAMADAGFRHIRDEWWHYSASDPESSGPIDVRLDLPGADQPKAEALAAAGAKATPAERKASEPSRARVAFAEKETPPVLARPEKPRRTRTAFPLRPGETP